MHHVFQLINAASKVDTARWANIRSQGRKGVHIVVFSDMAEGATIGSDLHTYCEWSTANGRPHDLMKLKA